MLRLHCEACGRSTPADAEPGVILPTRFEVLAFSGGPAREADLCLSDIARLSARYYGVEPDGRSPAELEREALLGPPLMPAWLDADAEVEAEVEA